MTEQQSKEFTRTAKQLPSLVSELTQNLIGNKPNLAVIVINILLQLLNKLKKQLKDSREDESRIS